MNVSTHQKRILTASLLVFFPALALVLLGIPLFLMVLLFSSMSLKEFFDLRWSNEDRRGLKWLGLAAGGGILWTSWSGGGQYLPLALLCGLLVVSVYFLKEYGRDQEAIAPDDMAFFLAGLIYVPLSFQLFFGLARMEMILVLVAAMSTDTAAYYFGSLFGKAKLWPAISPKKTWAGLYGGLLVCTVATMALGIVFGQASWWMWIILGLLMGGASAMGDLFESALKRACRVKDSSNILPGHGGVLDRVDGLIFVLVVYRLYKSVTPALF